VLAQECHVERMIFASRDAVCLHTYSGEMLETYADTPAGVCAHKAEKAATLFVQQLQVHTAVSEQQVSVQHNWEHQTAELFATCARAHG
jgi:hypothetical protein